MLGNEILGIRMNWSFLGIHINGQANGWGVKFRSISTSIDTVSL